MYGCLRGEERADPVGSKLTCAKTFLDRRHTPSTLGDGPFLQPTERIAARRGDRWMLYRDTILQCNFLQLFACLKDL
jgi:hypothetical protein